MDTSGSPAAPDSEVRLEHFALHSGAQQLAASLQLSAHGTAKNLAGHVQLEAIRLQDLPPVKALGKKVAGLVDAHIDAKGDPAAPRVDVKVALREGRFDTFQGLAAELVATLRENHTAHGTARVHAQRLGDLSARFDGPATSAPRPSAPVAVVVDIRDVNIGDLLGSLALPPGAGVKARGMADAHVDVHGTVGDPRLAVRLTGRNLVIDRSSTDATQQARFESVVIASDYASPRLSATVTVVDEKQGSLRATATTSIPFAQLRTPGALAIRERHIEGSLRLHNLDPEPVAAFVPSLSALHGQISASFDVRGTVAAPELGGELSWRKGKLVLIPAPPHAEKIGAAPSRAGIAAP